MWITTGFVIAVLFIAAAIAVSVAKAQSRHWFACPRCGKMFQTKWTQLIFEIHALDKHRLKCPYCDKTCFCTDKGRNP